MRIPFDVGFVFHPGASDEENAVVLRILLEALIACNMVLLERRRVPKLYDSGVIYGRTDVWDSIPDLYKRTYGDCKSLTAARVAELRTAGKPAQPVFRFAQNPQTGRREFHILVQGRKGFEDPSRKMGMEEYHRKQGKWFFPE
jgi:hypothetical protein